MDTPLVPPLKWTYTFLSVGRSKGRDCVLSKTSLLVKSLFVNGKKRIFMNVVHIGT